MLHHNPGRTLLGLGSRNATSPPFHGVGLGVNDKVFFGIQPPANTATSIARLTRDVREKHGLVGKPVLPRCLHISLLFVGYFGRLSQDMLSAFGEAAATIRMPPFRIALDRVLSFRHPQQRPLVLSGDEGVTGLVWLRDKLVAATTHIRGTVGARNFTPHLTLLRDGQEVREEPVAAISWTATEFILIRSVYGEGRHIPLARWTLRG